MYLMSHSSTGVCQLASELRYCFCRRMQVDVVDDNCCFCNYAALKKMLELGEVLWHRLRDPSVSPVQK